MDSPVWEVGEAEVVPVARFQTGSLMDSLGLQQQPIRDVQINASTHYSL